MRKCYDIKPMISTSLKVHERQISAQSIHLIWLTRKRVLYDNSFLVDQCLKSAKVFIQDVGLKNAITDLNVATSVNTIFCYCYRGHRDSLESLNYD